MRTIIITLLLLLTFNSPTWASQSVYVNGKQIEIDIIEKDGKLYAPLRTIAENLDSYVIWMDGSLYISKWMSRPPIKGDDRYVRKVDEALVLLQRLDPVIYKIICDSITTIEVKNTPPDSSEPYVMTENGCLTISPILLDDPRRNTPAYIGGILGHQAIRSTQYGFGHTDKGLSEVQAYNYKISILSNIFAPDWAVNETIETAKNIINNSIESGASK